MKRPTLANENMASMYPGRTLIAPTTKTPIQAYQKPLGFNFNSPKSEAQKGFIYSQKVTGTNLRTTIKVEKPEPALERKNSKTNSDALIKPPTPSQITSGSTRPSKVRGSSTKISSSDKYKAEQFELNKPIGGVKYSEALNLRDSLLKQSKPRNIEVSAEVQAFKSLGGIRAFSTKNKDPQDRSVGPNGHSFSSLDYNSKYLANQTSVNNQSKYDYVRTEGSDEKQSLTPTLKQKNALGRILANTSEKGQGQSAKKPSQTEEDSGLINGASQNDLKVNNFFASSAKRKELENSLLKKDKPVNISVKQSSTSTKEDLARPAEINMKMANKSQLEYKSAYKAFASNDDSKDEVKDVRNLSLTSSNKDTKASSSQKASLSSFITKVDKGTTLPIKPKKDEDDSPGLAPTRPYLTLEDKAVKPSRNQSEAATNSRSTSNTESRTITFSKSRLNQQALASSSLEGSKSKVKSGDSFSVSKELNKDTQEDTNDDNTPTRESFTYYVTSLEKYHRNWTETDYFAQIYKEHFIQSFQALTFCKYLRPVDPKMLAQKKVFLPKRPTHKDKKTVIFDLDETLIHCNESTDIPSDVVLPIRFPHGEIIEAGINVRPYAIECLKEISQHFEVIVFTASHSCYANVVLDYLDPQGQYVHHRLFRENCVVTDEGIYIKDLRILGNRNLQDVVLVDNAAYSFGYQVENGIPVIPFYDNKEDQELKHLIPYLKSLNSVKDCRELNKQTFKLHNYTMYDTLDKVLNKVVLRN